MVKIQIGGAGRKERERYRERRRESEREERGESWGKNGVKGLVGGGEKVIRDMKV